MNILYLIGNGFDLAQGLKTSYQDFYKYLLTQEPVNKVASLMLEHIKGPEVELWKDMEIKLGEFTGEISDKDQFEVFYYDLCEKLRAYLTAQADSYTPKKENKEKYIKDLVSPYDYLNNRDKSNYQDFFRTFTDSRYINIVSFNYTDVLENIIDVYNPQVVLPSTQYKYFFREIINVHGRLNTSYLLMGVNDASQIKNPDFARDEDILDYMVKPRSNYEMGTMVDDRFEKLIAESNLIVTMGLSFGESDSYWWQQIGNRLKSDFSIRVLLFEYVKDLPNDLRKQQRIRRAKRNDFLAKCGIAETEHDNYVNKVIVSLNTGLFSPNSLIYNDDRKGF